MPGGMNPGRLWRTTRHLTVEQISQMVVRRVRHAAHYRLPRMARRRMERRARLLPVPDPARPAVCSLLVHVQALQAAVHVDDTGSHAGEFRFLGRNVDFGSLPAIEWRRDLGEESSPLWRLTLAYLGWALPLLVSRGSPALQTIAACIDNLERACPWSSAGAFRDIWSPYTASHRLINLLCAAALGRQLGNADAVAEATILRHVRFCATYIASDLERDLQLNHLLKNYVALAAYLSGVDEIPASMQFLEKAVPKALDQVVLADGGHAERSPMYHALGLLDLRLLRDSGVYASAWQPDLDRRIEAMEHVLPLVSHPDGDIALFSDSWLGGSPPSAKLVSAVPPLGRHDLPAMGYTQLNGGEDRIIMDCGLLGIDCNPAHGHADYLSLEASISGCRFIVDFGTPTYVTGALRDLSRSAAAHNGPRVEGMEPAEMWKSFRVGRRGRAGWLDGAGLDVAPLWVAGWQDGYASQAAAVRRWVGLWPNAGFVVADLWRGVPVTRARSDFLIASPWRAVAGPDLAFEGPSALSVSSLVGRMDPLVAAEWWPRYGERREAARLVLRPDDSGFAAMGVFRRGAFPSAIAAVANLVRGALSAAHRSTGPSR